MTELSPWSIAAVILASLGGGGVIVAALLHWLGNIIARRILQREQQELGLAHLSYDKHVQHVADYYAMFYKSYQLIQRTTQADLIQHPDRADLDTKEDYLAKVDDIASEWNNQQGLLRLVLPQKALNLHEQAINEFNKFTNLVKAYDHNSIESRNALNDCFSKIDTIKQQLESCLRIHLRTDKV